VVDPQTRAFEYIQQHQREAAKLLKVARVEVVRCGPDVMRIDLTHVEGSRTTPNDYFGLKYDHIFRVARELPERTWDEFIFQLIFLLDLDVYTRVESEPGEGTSEYFDPAPRDIFEMMSAPEPTMLMALLRAVEEVKEYEEFLKEKNNWQRTLTERFLALPFRHQRDIINGLDVLTEEEKSLPNEVLFRLLFKRTVEHKLIESLRHEVEKRTREADRG